MIQETSPLVAPTEELAPEAMINEGGAIAQPRRSAPADYSLTGLVRDYPLLTLCTAFGLGALLGGSLACD